MIYNLAKEQNTTFLRRKDLELSDGDLDFVIQEAAPEFKDKAKLKRLIREDESFRKALIGDVRVFRKVIADKDILLKISPALYFEILLRQTLKELGKASHTLEKIGTEQIPVFDTKAVVNLLVKEEILKYLADMLSSFTRIESYTIPIRVRKGVWRKLRFSDFDIDALILLCHAMDKAHRFSFYKRIGDVCLFILGIFPEYAPPSYPHPSQREIRLGIRTQQKSEQEYEEEGKKFYKLAAEHDSARELELSEVFWLLYQNFNIARKSLNFIAQHYLHHKKHHLFGIQNLQ